MSPVKLIFKAIEKMEPEERGEISVVIAKCRENECLTQIGTPRILGRSRLSWHKDESGNFLENLLQKATKHDEVKHSGKSKEVSLEFALGKERK